MKVQPAQMATWCVIAAFAATGCYYDTFDTVDEFDAVATVRDPGRDYSVSQTYAMPERVFDLSDLVSDPIDVNHDLDDQILAAIAVEMASLGYDRIADVESPEVDVIITAGVVASESTWVYGGWYDWWYWDDWWIYYPPTFVSVSVPNGSLVLFMNKPDEANEKNQMPIIWTGGVRGILRDDRRAAEETVVSGIEQAFAQSSYLRVGPPVDPEPGLEDPNGPGDGPGDGGNTDSGGTP